jgi:hypothetical protein
MLSFLKPRTQASGFTLQDDDIAQEYIACVLEKDQAGANAVLAAHGWTAERVTLVLDHFHPQRVYTATEMAAARAALALFEAGQEKEAKKLLKRQRLTDSDVSPAVNQYWAALEDDDEDDEDETDAPVASEPAPARKEVERMVVPVPAAYKDSLDERAKLIAALWRKLGDGWQVETFDAGQSAVSIIRGALPAMRPGAEIYGAGPNASTGNGEAIAAGHAAYGRTMLGYDPYKRQAETAVLPPATIELRSRLLRKDSKQKSWELELLPLFSVTDGVGHLDRVIITRANVVSQDRAKEIAIWLETARTVVGHEGWRVTVDAKTGWIEMIHGVRPELPSIVPGHVILPQAIDTKNWSNFVIGLNSKNEKVCISLEAGPHSLVVGGTGSGKSVALRAIILNALAHGFEVVIIDPTKQAAGLRGIEPWTKGIFIKDLEEAAGALNAVYKEVRRRVDMITAVRGENWLDLPKGSVRPILVLVDEYSALVTPDRKPLGLSLQDPVMIEWSADASARAQIQSKVGRIAKEARSAGVHLVLSTQRPDASDIGGNVRENLGTIVQMIAPARPPSPEALRMVFPSDYVSMATEEIDLLNDGRSRGFALSYIEGGGLQAVRIGFVDKDDMEEYAERLDIPLGEPLEVAESEPRAFETVEQVSYPKIVELGEMELDLGDLDFDDLPATTETVKAPELDWSDAFDAETPSAAAAVADDPEWDETPAAPAAEASQEDPFAAEPKTAPRFVPDDDDPFGEPTPPKPKIDAFQW